MTERPRSAALPPPAFVFLAALSVVAVACSLSPGDAVLENGHRIPRGGADEAMPIPGTCSLGFVRVGLVPQGDLNELPSQFAPLEAHLGAQLGARVELVAYTDYDQLVTDLIRGDLDVAQLPPLAFVLARERDPDLPLLATQTAGGDVRYSGYLLVRRDSAVTRLIELENRRVAFVSTASASGFVFPMARLLQENVNVRAVMSRALFTGSHRAAIQAVLDGEADAVATYNGGMALARDTGLDTRALRVLGITEAIPQEALVAHSGVPAQHLKCLQRAFLVTNKASALGRSALARFAAQDGWTTTNEQFYDLARDQLRAVRAALPEVEP